MTRTVTGLFDTRQEADAVVDHLLQDGQIQRSAIRVYGSEGVAPALADDKGFWASLKDLFIPDEDRYTYSEGIRRGGIVVAADVPDALVTQVSDIFEQHGAVDLDTREAEWRQQGWKTYGNDAVVGGAMTAVGTASTTEPARVPPAVTPDTAAASASHLNDKEEVIPVVEEQIKIGKRDVEHGRVRVRSYIVETPVNETVTLRDEHVQVERRPVDQPLSAADEAFRERTIEAVEHTEEAVVSKEARVKEELVIRKDVEQHQETVSDTVRRTEVEIEDDRSAKSPTAPRQ
ncbi:YsnF/AvaK domain-containing protein [Roseomonas chloroacetimidivorans]|uniref:YsnF/AvaK domain-containing protein n=1 Tax=Roseomonas chloroacetimidivorans TaxID=1766656 RepID=UPI003C765BB4